MTDALNEGWEATKPKFVVQHARGLVDGHTAKEIFVIADSERQKGIAETLAVYRDQLAKTEAALNDIRAEAATAAKDQTEQAGILELIEITKPRFAFRKESFLVKPTISFSIANKGTIPIKTIYMHGKVQTPGRAVPWVEHDLNYAFPGGLEPGEAKDMNLEPNMFSEWKNVPQDAVKGAVLSLTLLAVEDAAGKHIGQDVAHDDDVSQRQKALEDEIAALKKKINDLERELKPGG